MDTQKTAVLNYLKKHGSITSLEMFDKFCICCPQAVIRDLRNALGADAITDEWIKKVIKTYDKNHKPRIITKQYKMYFLASTQ